MARAEGKSGGNGSIGIQEPAQCTDQALKAVKFVGKVPEPGRVEGGSEYVMAAQGNVLTLRSHPVPHVVWERNVRGEQVRVCVPLTAVLSYAVLDVEP